MIVKPLGKILQQWLLLFCMLMKKKYVQLISQKLSPEKNKILEFNQ